MKFIFFISPHPQWVTVSSSRSIRGPLYFPHSNIHTVRLATELSSTPLGIRHLTHSRKNSLKEKKRYSQRREVVHVVDGDEGN